MRRAQRLSIAIGAAALIGVTSYGIASASIPDSNKVIHACYTTSSGALRVIDTDAGQSCYSYETAISWSSSTAAPLTYSNGTVTIPPNGEFTITCPDGGIPANLYWSGVLNNQIAGEGVVTNSSGQPDGINGVLNGLSGQNISYTLICS